MSIKWKADGLVQSSSENLDRYKRNFLQQAVCELRFPTLMALGESKPPSELVSVLRKDYPHLELSNELTIGPGGTHDSVNTHIFRSAKLNWAISFKQSSMSIETTAYSDYKQMKERILGLVKSASKIIDTDFFTRVGIRYINIIDNGYDPADGWVNPALVSPLSDGNFTGVSEYAGKMQLSATDGGCLLQHGVRMKKPHLGKIAIPAYLIDIDSFRNEVLVSDTGAALDAIHAQAFDIFDWAIGPKSREFLSTAKS